MAGRKFEIDMMYEAQLRLHNDVVRATNRSGRRLSR